MSRKLNKHVKIYISEDGTAVPGGGSLINSTWYRVSAVDAATAMPKDTIGAIFKAGGDITLAAGDEAIPLTLTVIAQTMASIKYSQGSLDLTDSESIGSENMLNKITAVEGSIARTTRYNTNGTLSAFDEKLLRQFMATTTDDGVGGYAEIPETDANLLMFLCMNSDAQIGDTQEWHIMPIIITEYTVGGELAEEQKNTLPYLKGEGVISRIQRVAGAGDIL